jgi:hypothetical protein
MKISSHHLSIKQSAVLLIRTVLNVIASWEELKKEEMEHSARFTTDLDWQRLA